ncbi:hypothetical protein Tco_0645245 [Tanacetum coccineum]
MLIVYCREFTDEHRDFALQVNRLIGDMIIACKDSVAFVGELQSVAGENVSAKTAVFLEEMVNKKGSMEWQLHGLEKEAREMAFEIDSFLLKLVDEEPSHKRVFRGDDGQRGNLLTSVKGGRDKGAGCAGEYVCTEEDGRIYKGESRQRYPKLNKAADTWKGIWVESAGELLPVFLVSITGWISSISTTVNWPDPCRVEGVNWI